MAEEQAKDDTKANPEDRNVVDGPALKQLRNGTFMRGGRRHDVSAPEGEGAFKWHPDDLRIPLDALKLRYDQPVWEPCPPFGNRCRTVTLLGFLHFLTHSEWV